METALNSESWLVSNFEILSCFDYHLKDVNPSKFIFFEHKTFFFNFLCLFVVEKYNSNEEV